MDSAAYLFFNKIARSHMYWGRKPLVGLLDAFRDLGMNSILLDPFCGGGSSVVGGLRRGARVIASDLNPMAVFLTKVLLRPLSIPKLGEAFLRVSTSVAEPILDRYVIRCAKCGRRAHIDWIAWGGRGLERRPDTLKSQCAHCGVVAVSPPSRTVAKRQVQAANSEPEHWYPDTAIHGTRKAAVSRHAQLFTGRNLAALAELFEAIQSLSSGVYREALEYVFTAILYSCSEMQMFSEGDPSSSRGWYALRYYIPPKRKEKNVWRAFEDRYQHFIACKRETNRLLPNVQITHSIEEFFEDNYRVLLRQEDVFALPHRLVDSATHIFLDPPYVQDLEYLAFSEFWGSWLRMKFDFAKEWKARPSDKETIARLLTRLNLAAKGNTTIILAFHSKSDEGGELQHSVERNAYNVVRSGAFFCDNSQGRAEKGNCRDRFFVLSRNHVIEQPPGSNPRATNAHQMETTLYYMRVAAFRWPRTSSGETLKERTSRFLPPGLRETLRTVGSDQIASIVQSEQATAENRKAYETLCCHLIADLLAKDEWTIEYVNPLHVAITSPFGSFPLEKTPCLDSKVSKAAFVFRRGASRIVFCFDGASVDELRRIASTIDRTDAGKYETVSVLVVPSAERMQVVRQHDFASEWPRGFFTSYNEIVNLHRRLCTSAESSIYPPLPEARQTDDQESRVAGFYGKVLANIQVGGLDSPYRKLRFEAKELQDIIPGQFIMMDTRAKVRGKRKKAANFADVRAQLDLHDRAFLKRPFGIHRTFYQNFSPEYVKYLHLPPQLARILHTIHPHEFDIFFKILPNGKGTHEMAELSRGDRVEMIGPLGKRFDLRELRDGGVQEVHVIGGGVGMAPLIFLVQALRFFAFRVVAFIGIEKLDILDHEDPTAAGYVANTKDVRVFIDDLAAAGLGPDDVYVSCDVANGSTPDTIKHMHTGFVSDQYRRFLSERKSSGNGNVQAFACGPTQMMKAVHDVACDYAIPLKVLQEKRMACGFGVCFSCVCETRKNGETKYSRVCTDGPIFDAAEIIW